MVRERITVQDDGYLASRSDSSESENDSRRVSILTGQKQIQELISQRPGEVTRDATRLRRGVRLQSNHTARRRLHNRPLILHILLFFSSLLLISLMYTYEYPVLREIRT